MTMEYGAGERDDDDHTCTASTSPGNGDSWRVTSKVLSNCTLLIRQ
jgi:hypothetical protein